MVLNFSSVTSEGWQDAIPLGVEVTASTGDRLITALKPHVVVTLDIGWAAVAAETTVLSAATQWQDLVPWSCHWYDHSVSSPAWPSPSCWCWWRDGELQTPSVSALIGWALDRCGWWNVLTASIPHCKWTVSVSVSNSQAFASASPRSSLNACRTSRPWCCAHVLGK